jgi:ASC-1-like (ASCH) protein
MVIYFKKIYREILKKIKKLKMSRSQEKHLSQPFFDDVRSGAKRFEGRICAGFWAEIELCDEIVWFNDDRNKGFPEKFSSIVKGVTYHASFKEAIEAVGLANVLPSEHALGHNTDEAIENVYRKFYSKNDEKIYGVVLIELELKLPAE